LQKNLIEFVMKNYLFLVVMYQDIQFIVNVLLITI